MTERTWRAIDWRAVIIIMFFLNQLQRIRARRHDKQTLARTHALANHLLFVGVACVCESAESAKNKCHYVTCTCELQWTNAHARTQT